MERRNRHGGLDPQGPRRLGELGRLSHDGTRVLTASNDTTTRLWDTNTGAAVAVLRGDDGFIDSAVFSPDDRLIATASYDRTARQWRTGTEAAESVFQGHDAPVNSAVFSPDQSRIGSASFDTTARLWDARSGALLLVLRGHKDTVWTIAFSADGERVVTASDDKTARIWDAATGAMLLELPHDDRVDSAAFSPDGKRVVTTSTDDTATIWDAEAGTKIAVLRGHTDWVTAAAFSPDGKRVVTASYDATARIWDAETGTQILVLQGHMRRINSAVFSPDCKHVATASWDNTARIWEAETGKSVAVLHGHEHWVISPRLLAGRRDGWSRHLGIRPLASGMPPPAPRSSCFAGTRAGSPSRVSSSDGRHVVSASYDKTARLWLLPPHCQVLIDEARKKSCRAVRCRVNGSNISWKAGLPARRCSRRSANGMRPCFRMPATLACEPLRPGCRCFTHCLVCRTDARAKPALSPRRFRCRTVP